MLAAHAEIFTTTFRIKKNQLNKIKQKNPDRFLDVANDRERRIFGRVWKRKKIFKQIIKHANV